MSTTIDAVIKNVFAGPILDGLPVRTRFVESDDTVLHWDVQRDCYTIWLYTPWSDHMYMYTSVELKGSEVHQSSGVGFAKQLAEKLKLLRMRHYFNLAYSRGGYC